MDKERQALEERIDQLLALRDAVQAEAAQAQRQALGDIGVLMALANQRIDAIDGELVRLIAQYKADHNLLDSLD